MFTCLEKAEIERRKNYTSYICFHIVNLVVLLEYLWFILAR